MPMPGQGGKVGSGRLDETPVRRSTGIVAPEGSPGTPPTGQGTPGPLQFLQPADVLALRFLRRWQRLLQTAVASPVDGYGTDLLGVIPLSQFGAELYAPDEVLAAGTFVGTATAAEYSAGVLNNPAASGVVLVVTYVKAVFSAAGVAGLYVGANPGATAPTYGSTVGRDGRQQATIWAAAEPANGGTKGQVGFVLFANPAPTTGTPIDYLAGSAANTEAHVGNPDDDRGFVVLAPGEQLILQYQTAVNTLFTGGFWWREVPLLQA